MTEQRKRLLSRLRTRFDVCFAIALTLAAVARLAIPYVSLAALPLSVALVWVGYMLVARPVRDGIAEVDGALWENVFRKLLLASVVQWSVLVCILHIGKLDFENSNFGENPVLRYQYDGWKPVIFLVGLLLIWALLERTLRRLAGGETRLLYISPSRSQWEMLATWIVWLTLLYLTWRLVGGRFDEVIAPWIERYGEDVLTNPYFDTIWPKAKARRDAEVLPWLWARWAVLAAGGVTGLGLLGWTLLRWKKRQK